MMWTNKPQNQKITIHNIPFSAELTKNNIHPNRLASLHDVKLNLVIIICAKNNN